MNVSIQKILWLIISLIVAVLSLLCLQKGCKQVSDSRPINADSLSPVKYGHDRSGNLISIIRQQEVKLLESTRIIDSLSKALKVKPVQIKSIDRYVTVTDTLIVDHVKYLNSADSVIISKVDDYINLKAVGMDSGRSSIHLQHFDTLYRISVTKTPLLGKPLIDVYLRSASPYNKIVAGNSLHIPAPRPMLSLGPSFGYDILSHNLTVGVSVQIPLFNIYTK